MSKVDAQRAMREARFAAYRATREAAAAAAPAVAAPPKKKAAPTPPPAEPTPWEGDAEAAAPRVTAAQAAAPEVAPEGSGAAENSTAAGPELCGHRNMGNKSCLRPAGHPEKSHRYKV